MPRVITFELCAETLTACIAANDGGAHRIELCTNLAAGGLTPPPTLIREALALVDIPIHIMVRPRPGNFLYSPVEIAIMRNTIQHARNLGVAGIVLGLLHPDNTIDVDQTRNFVDLAHPLTTTFHRAFDEAPNLPHALEAVIATGCTRILTSGGAPNVSAGATTIANLVTQARNRIHIAAGGGLRLHNASSIARSTHAKHFHASLLHDLAPGQLSPAADDVRSIIQRLQPAATL